MSTHDAEPIQADTGMDNHVVGTLQLIKDGQVQLIPTPSSDPNDPLNWPQWKKYMVTGVLCYFTIVGLAIIQGIGSILPTLEAAYPTEPVWKVTYLANQYTLIMGLSTLFTVPMAIWIGRRPVYILMTAFLCFGCVWAAFCQSLDSHIGARTMQAIGIGCGEIISPLILQEIFFLHERGHIIGFLWSIQQLGCTGLSIAFPYITAAKGWRWAYGVFAFVSLPALLMAVFCLPETSYDRSTAIIEGGRDAVVGDTKDTGDTQIEYVESVTVRHGHHIDYVNYTKKTYMQELRLFQTGKSGKTRGFLYTYVEMVQSLMFPVFWWCVALGCVCQAVLTAMIACFSTVLMESYAWPASNIGLFTIAQIPASVLAYICTGWGSDKIAQYLTKRNNGVRESEFRFFAVILPSIFEIAGTMLFAAAAQHPEKISWFGFACGYFLHMTAFAGFVTLGSLLTLDSYQLYAGAILTSFYSLRNILGYSLGGPMDSYTVNHSYMYSFGIMAGLMGLFALFGIPLYFFNKRTRKWSSKMVLRIASKATKIT